MDGFYPYPARLIAEQRRDGYDFILDAYRNRTVYRKSKWVDYRPHIMRCFLLGYKRLFVAYLLLR